MSHTQRPTLSSLEPELKFAASRSSGPGGQNVNKVNTKITLKWDVQNSKSLSEEQRELLLKKLENKLTADGVLVLMSQDKRSQIKNKEDVLSKLDQLLTKVFTFRKKRKATRPTKASQKKRIDSKKQRGEKKQWRKKL